MGVREQSGFEPRSLSLLELCSSKSGPFSSSLTGRCHLLPFWPKQEAASQRMLDLPFASSDCLWGKAGSMRGVLWCLLYCPHIPTYLHTQTHSLTHSLTQQPSPRSLIPYPLDIPAYMGARDYIQPPPPLLIIFQPQRSTFSCGVVEF